MTEMTPLGTSASCRQTLAGRAGRRQFRYRAAGHAVAVRRAPRRDRRTARPWDGKTMGELEVRGPWVAAAVLQRGRAEDRSPTRLVPDRRHRDDRSRAAASRSRDRAKDVVKSGGEWISSVALENALMGHPAWRKPRSSPCRIQVGRAAAGGRRAEAGHESDQRGTDRICATVRQVVAARRNRFAAEIPRTSVGQVQEVSLRDSTGTDIKPPME